ncbi:MULTISPECIES: alpha/beta hydrolase [Brevibacillus]|jgi:dienelactone hydrolase|uniref:alpha/beta hydrolase n=1 Tax=Brevibacillus TaxID=55080 RepID=UPI00057BE17B|nr:alpha/beta hydrolase [Brevibacillus borstelensis]MBE5394168.1 alpha/beta hydrolase [Brevibacillus borstelensis]
MMESFRIPVDEELVIRGDFHAQEKDAGQPLLIFCHGFKGFKDWGSFPYAANRLAKLGMAVVRFNFSCNGVGESGTEFDELEKFGRNTYAREIADLRVLTEWLHSEACPFKAAFDREKLFVMGHSKGGADAILFGANHPLVKGIITWNGTADVDLFDARLRQEIAEKGVGYIANARTGQQMPITKAVIDDVDQNREAYNLLAKVSSMEQPLCIIQGTKDYERLVKGAKRLQEAAKDVRVHWIEEGDHTFNTRHPFAGPSPQLESAIEHAAAFVHALCT